MTLQSDGAAVPGGASYAEASRFLVQAGFGGGASDIENVRRGGLERWFVDQTETPMTAHLPRFLASKQRQRHDVYPLFWENAIHGEDQLRHKVAYALSQITVISLSHAAGTPDLFVLYLDILQDEALGNYRDLLRRVTYTPAMGLYLSHLNNQKADPRKGTTPDENYARELMQLFTIGLDELDESGRPTGRPSYGPSDVAGLAAIMTGLSWAGQKRLNAGYFPRKDDPARLMPFDAYSAWHETGTKRFLGYEVAGDDPIRAIDGAIDHLVAHPNTAPFVTRQLIQRLVTSNPSPAYVARAGRAFATGRYTLPSGRQTGDGRRGDMKATLAAILFDVEARGEARLTAPTFGRIREHTMRYAHIIRAFREPYTLGPAPARMGEIANTHTANQFGEQPWYAPSVFGTFYPGYQSPGSKSAATGMAAPALQVMNASSIPGFIQTISQMVDRPRGQFLTCDFSGALAVADDGKALADKLNKTLCHGAAPTELLDKIATAADLIPTGRGAPDRARKRRLTVALVLIATDSSFAVQR